MNRRRWMPRLSALVSLVLLLSGAPARAAAPAPAAERATGEWHGALEAGGRTLHVVFHLARGADGALTATMDSPDQGALGIPMDAATVHGDTLRLTIARLAGAYQGVLAADGATVRGTWTQGGFTMPLDLGRAAAPERRRPQDPVPPFPYDEEDVRVADAAAHVTLAGTLTKPHGAGPFPAVVLVTGSGPQDRDEQLLGHRPFRVLADRLTRAGLAVLRCDDRGVAGSTGDFATATTLDFAEDARAEVEFLRARPDVDPARVGLVGHSEGALVAELLGSGRTDLAFVVLLAGPGVPGDSLFGLQAAALARAAGRPEAFVDWNRRLQKRLFGAALSTQDTSVLRARVRQVLEEGLAELPSAERHALGETFADAQVAFVTSPWFRTFVQCDPRLALRRTFCPVLAVTGSRDLQVPARENLSAIAASLAAAKNPDYSTVELPGLNHLFQTCTTGLPDEYGTLEETFAPAALDTVTAWIRRHVTAR